MAGPERVGTQAVREADWIRPERLPDQSVVPPFSSLDLGEAEVLTLPSFREPSIPLLLDDRRARSFAMNLGSP